MPQPEVMQDLDPPGDAAVAPAPPSAEEAQRTSFAAIRSNARRGKLIAVAAFLLLAGGMLFYPSFADSRYHLTLATLTMMWMGLASSWNLISGFTSYASFGHAALFGLGSYIVGIGTVRYELNVYVALAAAGALVGLFSLFLGFLTLRTKGHYFAIATLGVSEGVRVIVNSWRSYTKGSIGFSLPIDLVTDDGKRQFYAMLGALAAIVAVSAAILWSRFGTRLLAIRDDEEVAEALGVRASGYKIAALVLSGAFAGLFGGIFAWVLGYLTPEATLTPLISLQIAVMAILGGRGTLLGPLVGGAAFYLVGEYLLVKTGELHAVLLGLVLICTMLFLRQGIVGTLQATRIWPRGLRL